MLADSTSNSYSTNTPQFTSSVKIESLYEEILIAVIPFFINTFSQKFNKEVLSETDLSQNFGIVLDRYIKSNDKIRLCIRENSKDIYSSGANNKKMPDFSFYSCEITDTIKPLYNIEAKRLPQDTKKREYEYVWGYFKNGSSAGGIQRFKTGDHGYGLPKSALLGYIEENDFAYWHNTINSWIVNRAKDLPDEWKDDEQLQNLDVNSSQIYSVCRSVAHRKLDSIDLFHLWIKIP